MPVLALSGWLLAGLPLLLLGWFRPLPMAVFGGGLAVALCWYGLRRIPPIRGATATQVAAVLGVAVASGLFNGLLHGEQLIVRRDPATYAQYAIWLATHGSLPIPPGDFGGSDLALRFDSMGFFRVDGGIVPQFMAGPPMIYAVGHWLGGVPGLLLTPPVLGALAVLTFAGTAARLVGPRWAPVAALALGVSLPVLYTSRTTFSEIPSLIALFGGMSLLADARSRLRAETGSPGRAARRTAVLAGLAFGLALLVRVDGLRDVLPVLAFTGLLIALGRISRAGAVRPLLDARLGWPLLGGLAVGALWGLVACYVLARPYLSYLSGSLRPLLGVAVAVVICTVAGAVLGPWLVVRRAGMAGRTRGPRPTGLVSRWFRLPDLAWAAVVLVVAGLAVRPWVQTVRRVAVSPEDRLNADFVRQTQLANGLPVDPTRLYDEYTLDWVLWYVGVPVLLLATLAAAILARRLVRGTEFGWLLPLAIIGWTMVTTLWRPAITPDHPWASRRLVPVVIPGLILLAVWGLRWCLDRGLPRLRGLRLPGFRGRGEWPRPDSGWLTAAGAVLLVTPIAVTSIGTAFTPVNRGEAAAVHGLCAAIPHHAAVLIVERVTGDRFTQVVRGQCGVPTARVAHPTGVDLPRRVDVERLIRQVRRTGRQPVLLAAEPGQLAGYGQPTRVLALRGRQDERSLVSPPDGTWSLSIDAWMAVPR